ncbi:uncharacterized protein LOC123293793 [Chrysoperla carnea]|uniref:uncharacterized protein LOC123293793 n=1 Tax=Chrysoperla carnea TaxID=189513 RepID=UPI001D07A939|nr:uncharacterized protein LOC123293793 [Chrysoperla carnea]
MAKKMSSTGKLRFFPLNNDKNYLPYVDTNSNSCICYRNERTIQCTGCGFIAKGRVARQCKYHQSVIYLLDFKSCPFCDAPAECIKEYITNEHSESPNTSYTLQDFINTSGNDLNNNAPKY